MIWLVAAILSVATGAAILWRLYPRGGSGTAAVAGTAEYDLEIYRDQLRELGRDTGCQQLRTVEPVSPARPDNPVAKVLREPVRVYVDEPDNEVGVYRRRCGPENHSRVAANLDLLLQRVRLVHENVLATFQQPVVTRRVVAVCVVKRHHWIARVIGEAIPRFIRRVDGRKRAIAGRGIRRAPAVEEELCVGGFGGRPFVRGPPPVGADDVEAGRGPVHCGVLLALQPVIEPLDYQVDVGQFGVGPEVDIPEGASVVRRVTPWPDDQSLRRARLFSAGR